MNPKNVRLAAAIPIIIIILTTLLSAACGQKGPLYLPDTTSTKQN